MTATDLLSAVLADPFDDGPRLILADWLDDNDIGREWSRFIRAELNGNESEAKEIWNENRVNGGVNPFVQPYRGCRVTSNWLSSYDCPEITFPAKGETVKIILRRGFVDEIQCTRRVWCGEECQRCGGIGYIGGWPCSSRCADGRAPGIAKAVCEQWPVTRVVLTDRNPDSNYSSRHWWYQRSNNSRSRSHIENVLFEGLCGRKTATHASDFESNELALAALSHAAINYGRRLAELKPLDTTR